MFAETNSPIWPPLVPLGVAVIAGGIAMWSAVKSNRNARDIQDVKSDVDRDLERLKSKLDHGKLISSTQWNAEFTAYQAVWKAMASLRAVAVKMTLREGDLIALGVDKQDVNPETSSKRTQDLLGVFAQHLNGSMLAINENAPFYPADIREAANRTQDLAHRIYTKHLAADVAFIKALPEDRDTQDELKELIEGVNSVEKMIRNRLREVNVAR